jgi:hypothetical protein
MANAHLDAGLTLGHLVEHHSAGTLGVLVEKLPQQGDLYKAELSSRLTGWTWLRTGGRLAQGEGHDIILLKRSFRMKSAQSPSTGQGPFLSIRKSMSLSQNLEIVWEARNTDEIRR